MTTPIKLVHHCLLSLAFNAGSQTVVNMELGNGGVYNVTVDLQAASQFVASGNIIADADAIAARFNAANPSRLGFNFRAYAVDGDLYVTEAIPFASSATPIRLTIGSSVIIDPTSFKSETTAYTAQRTRTSSSGVASFALGFAAARLV